MGSFYLILALVFGLIVAIIALANNEIVTVSYIFGRTEVSLIILILGSSFFGALIMGLFSLFRSIRTAFAFRDMRNKNEELQHKIKALEEDKIFLEAELNKAISVPEECKVYKTSPSTDQQDDITETDSGVPESEEAPINGKNEVDQ